MQQCRRIDKLNLIGEVVVKVPAVQQRAGAEHMLIDARFIRLGLLRAHLRNPMLRDQLLAVWKRIQHVIDGTILLCDRRLQNSLRIVEPKFRTAQESSRRWLGKVVGRRGVRRGLKSKHGIVRQVGPSAVIQPIREIARGLNDRIVIAAMRRLLRIVVRGVAAF